MNSLFRTLTFLITAFVLSACEKPPEKAEVERAQLVKTVPVAAQMLSGQRDFPATIKAHQRADLSFRVSGKVEQINFNDGSAVKKGQVIARLDARDYKIALSDREANYQRASADFKRAQELIEQGFISKTDFEQLQAAYYSEKAALNQAQLNLQYTEIKAPFDGTLSRRHIENHEEVQAKQVLFNFSDTSVLELIVDIPENLVQQYHHGNIQISTSALFSTMKDKSYPLTFKEFSTKADPQTQAFQASFLLDQPDDLVLLPGMTATIVIASQLSEQAKSNNVVIPLSAVVADNEMNPLVWKVDTETMRISPVAVSVNHMQGTNVEVISELLSGDIVVSAGANFLRDGQLIQVMEEVEQADPKTAP